MCCGTLLWYLVTERSAGETSEQSRGHRRFPHLEVLVSADNSGTIFPHRIGDWWCERNLLFLWETF